VERKQPSDESFGARSALDPEAQSINFSWLVRLRWGAIAGQALAIAIVHFAMEIALPLSWLAAILIVATIYNVACAAYVRRARAVRESMVAAAMAGDVLLLTVLLFFTGGPFNPFSFLYLVHIALAAVVLRSWWTWSLVGLSLLGFASLFIEHELLGDSNAMHAMHGSHGSHGAHAMHGAHADPGMDMHLQGMWVAFGIAAAFIVYFVSRVTRDLAAREGELAAARAAASRNEKLAALATLAAGAAHELATPLSTIAIVAKDLERSLMAEPERAGSSLEDAKLIRDEVARCRRILQQMSVEAGQTAGESAVATTPEAIVALALEGLQEGARVERTIEGSARDARLWLPEQAVALALRGILKNALEAVASRHDARGVTLRVMQREAGCVIEVHDDGAGMPESVLSRVGEPFFTTKEPGSGMGLGVFVARALCEQIGGHLEIDSAPGRGTTVSMRLPIDLAQSGARVAAPALEPA
jgi:two-component system sensor histidine kinase RegB